MKKTMLLLLVLWSLTTQSQSFDLTLIYQLTDAEAEIIYRESELELDSSHFHTYVDSFSTPRYTKELSPGYYLFVNAEWEQLVTQFRDLTTLSVQLLPDRRDLALQVLDSMGILVTDAEILLNRRKVPFDAKTQTYRLKKRKKGGFLKVHTRGETAFFSIEKADVYPYRNRFFSTTTGRILTTPYRWGRSVYYYFRRGFGYGDWHLDMHRLVPRAWRNSGPAYKGYIAFSQPKYRQGDTLRVKAFLTKPNGTPWNKETELSIRPAYPYQGKSIVDSLITPNHPGNFTFEMILADSLIIDRNYYVNFDHPRKEMKDGLDETFYLEDYELDEVTYTFQPEKETFYASDEIILLADAKDKNDLPVPGVEVRLIAKRGRISEFSAEEVRIPDTIWTHKQELETGGQTRISFPDSLLPAASLEIDLTAVFVNVKGEIQGKSARITYMRDTAYLRAWEEEGYAHASYYRNGEELPLSVNLGIDNPDHDIYRERQVDLPFRERIDPYMESYWFYTDSLDVELKINAYETGIQAQGYHTRDSVFVRIQNPKQIPFNYRIGPRGRTISEGFSEGPYFQWAGQAPAGTPYFLEYQYVWGGQSEESSVPIQFYKKLLQVKLETPAKVAPGEEVNFKVKVKDAAQQPVAGVDLTAGAVNAQFGGKASYSSPEINYKRTKSPRTYNDFDLSTPYQPGQWKQKISPKWVEKFQLKDSLFYRLRYSGEGVYMEYDSISQDTFYRNLAQFAPYIVRNGRTQPVILIYCNRQLVYYYDVDDNPPYSFAGEEGYNKLIIRTPAYEYIIDSVWLKKGHKLEIAIDEDRFRFGPMAKNIRRKAVPAELTYQEQDLLRQRIFILHQPHSQKSVFLWQDSLSIHRIKKSKGQYPLSIGPFRDDLPLHFKVPDAWETAFTFEPEFSYILSENRQKLYHAPLFKNQNARKLPVYLAPKPSGQVIYAPEVMAARPDLRIPLPPGVRSRLPDTKKKNAGRYQFEYESPRDTALLALALVYPDSSAILLLGRNRTFSSLPPGNYQLLLLDEVGSYFQHHFEIQANTLLYQKLGGMVWQKNNTGWIDSLFRMPISTFNQKREETSFHQDYDNYDGQGYELTGQVVDDTGEPLIGASILIKGTTIGTITDFDGRYTLNVPYDIRSPEVIVSYVGFASQEVILGRQTGNANIVLETDEMHLQELVVTGLGISRKQANTSMSTEELNDLMQGKVAGITTRGSRGKDTTYYVDGQKVANINHLRPEDIAQINILKDASSKAIYGADANQEVVLITTKKINDPAFSLELAPSSIRSQFRDYAFWEPTLLTDQNGEVFFKATFPDNLTSWNTFVIGMDGKRRAGTATSNIKSFKPVTGQLAVPRFLVAGDQTNLVGAAVNYTGDSLAIKTRFLLGDKTILEKDRILHESIVDKAKIQAEKDTLQLTYKLDTGDYFDGEQRSIPTYPKGLSISKGEFWALSQDTALYYTPDPQLGAVQFYVQGDVLPLLLEDLKYLRTYPYGCNEQTASRLIALLLEKAIRETLGEPFPHEKSIPKMVERLEKAQNRDGSWGWWPGNTTNDWMSIYVLRALLRAQEQGYKSLAVEKGLRRLTNRLHLLNRNERLSAIELLSEEGQVLGEAELHTFDTLKLNLTEQLRLIRIRQLQEFPYELDTLYRYQKESLLGGWYWEEEKGRWYGNITTPTLLAYQILKKKGETEALRNIQQYFLETRAQYSRYGWHNTFETAQILQTILPDLVKGDTPAKGPSKTTLQLNEQTVAKFPYRSTFPPNQPLSISKSGNRPLFLTAYQEEFVPEPKARRTLFDIRSYLTQEGQEVKALATKAPAKLMIEINVKKTAPYVMIEVPIPGGCSYYAKPNSRWNHPESHREYFKDRTVIFCESLPVGQHRFEIELEPRFAGIYTINPAKAEQMYFPTLFGNDVCKNIEVE